MKTVNLIRAVFSVIAMSSVSMFAMAGSSTADFQSLDKNGDGYISINEATGQLELLRKWVDADKNADGQIGRTEFSAMEESSAKTPAATFVPQDPENPELGAAPTR